MPVQTQIQQRRGTAASWTSTNPTLAAGEIGFESDTNRFKIGTGSTAWASLSYWVQDPVTTKGDLYTFSTTDTRLAVGANGETLVADSSTSTGLRYTGGTVQANPVLNSAFQVWQRGTSIAGSGGSYLYTADRWQTEASTSLTISRQATGDTTNLPFIQYCARVQRNNGSSSTALPIITQSMETINSVPFAGKTITFSFYARRGANFSSTSNLLSAKVTSGTGTDQNAFVGGYTGASAVVDQTATLTTTWQRFTFTGTVPTNATEIAVQFFYTPTGTAGAADFYEVTGVQLDVGSVALPFRTYAGTIQGELAACQRYYFRSTGPNAYSFHGTGAGITSTRACIVVQPPVTMRTTPGGTIDFGNIAISDAIATTMAVTSIGWNNTENPNNAVFDIGVASSLIASRPYWLINNNIAAGFIGFSAEL